ncbi:SH3 domain-binding protein 5 homolog [Homarus americanus]|uniref:SH3 domain-binding protein 5 homolog n=1 Tax=Homarus americanus TaxID=6706 RepID=UPI001C466911|nr:SH3 domain-binding protein 5 homolog [Homarus americanus]
MEEEQLDPRVQIELEKLNTATDDINKLEAKLEEANNVFRATLSESTARLKAMAKKLGGCIEKARPYYEARELARTSQLDCQRAAVQYQRANALHQAAKETIALAEERFVNCRHQHWQFDSAWQEMLNHATIKVMEAEAQKAASEREHMRRASVFQQAEQRVQQLQRGLRSSINKSLVYFDEKNNIQSQLENQKDKVQQLQRAISASKTSYAQSLRSLEQISEEIHQQRRCRLPREPGVGAELTPPEAVETLLSAHHGARPFVPLEEMTAQEEKYWETLREKLEKLQVSNPDVMPSAEGEEDESLSLCASPDGRERTVTGSSSGGDLDRVVSGESCPESESDEVHSPGERTVISLDDVLIHVPLDVDRETMPGAVDLDNVLTRVPVDVNIARETPIYLHRDDSTNTSGSVYQRPPQPRRTPVGCDGSVKRGEVNSEAVRTMAPIMSNEVINGSLAPVLSNEVINGSLAPVMSNEVINGSLAPVLSNEVINGSLAPVMSNEVINGSLAPVMNNELGDSYKNKNEMSDNRLRNTDNDLRLNATARLDGWNGNDGVIDTGGPNDHGNDRVDDDNDDGNVDNDDGNVDNDDGNDDGSDDGSDGSDDGSAPEGGSSLSRPPAMCQPSRALNVIPEAVETT